MRLGIQLFASRTEPGRSRRDVLAELTQLAVHAEKADYEMIWLAEHHRSDWNLCSDPLALLAHLAGITDHIRLGTAVVNLGIRHPESVAEQAALVNAVSDGRLELGVGRGFAPADYQRLGLSMDTSRGRFPEAVAELVGTLRSDNDSTDIPLWLATTGQPDTIDVALDHDAGLLLTAHGDKLHNILGHIRSRSATCRIGLTRIVHPAEDTSTARPELEPHLAWYTEQLSRLQPDLAQPDVTDVLDTFCITGTGDECRRQILPQQRQYGLTDFLCVFAPGLPVAEMSRLMTILRQPADLSQFRLPS